MAEPGKFRLYRTGDLFFWHLTNDLGMAIARSEEFPDRASAEAAIQWVKDNADNCGIMEPPSKAPSIG